MDGEQWRAGRASLEVRALDGYVQTLPVSLREPARVRYDEGRVSVERLEAIIGKTAVSVAGSLPVSSGATSTSAPADDALQATLTGDVYDVAVAAAVAASATTADPALPPIAAGKGPLVLLARVTGWDDRTVNTAKLTLSGQFTFLAHPVRAPE